MSESGFTGWGLRPGKGLTIFVHWIPAFAGMTGSSSGSDSSERREWDSKYYYIIAIIGRYWTSIPNFPTFIPTLKVGSCGTSWHRSGQFRHNNNALFNTPLQTAPSNGLGTSPPERIQRRETCAACLSLAAAYMALPESTCRHGPHALPAFASVFVPELSPGGSPRQAKTGMES